MHSHALLHTFFFFGFTFKKTKGKTKKTKTKTKKIKKNQKKKSKKKLHQLFTHSPLLFPQTQTRGLYSSEEPRLCSTKNITKRDSTSGHGCRKKKLPGSQRHADIVGYVSGGGKYSGAHPRVSTLIQPSFRRKKKRKKTHKNKLYTPPFPFSLFLFLLFFQTLRLPFFFVSFVIVIFL